MRNRKLNTYRFEDDYAVGICKDGTEFMFDTEEYDRISQYTWRINKNGIIESTINRKNTLLSRFILGLDTSSKKKVLLRNPLDYRKINLFYGNRYELCKDYYEVECYDGTKFKIDVCDYELIKDYVWHLSNNYITSKVNGKQIKLHRFLLSPKEYEEVDHKDRDTLNNRRNNLRMRSSKQ